MRLKRIKLENIRTFQDAEASDIPDVALFVSPNGAGKSTIFEAVAGVREIVSPYHQPQYPHRAALKDREGRIWPAHLRSPVTIGKSSGSIEIEIEASHEEAAILRERGIQDTVGTARVVLESPNWIVDSQATKVIEELFLFRSPSDGFGYLDYTQAVRAHQNLSTGNVTEAGTEAKVRNTFIDFHRGMGDTSKFSDFKTSVVAAQLNDSTAKRLSGRELDSLAPFRNAFDTFFTPKRFIGAQSTGPGGVVEVLVQTAQGCHDTNNLSDGEKEILQMLAHLYQFSGLANVVLWDTPEANLNARLEARLLDALRLIGPKNQYLLATHGLELIDSAPIDSIFAIRQSPHGAKIERLSEAKVAHKVSIYRELGARVGIQTVSSVVVFLEGTEARSDKTHLDRLLRSSVTSANLVAGGDCDTILGVGTRANQLLEAASVNGDFLAVVDRDYRDEAQLDWLEKNYKGQLFVWHVHELENLFLSPSLVFQVVEHAGLLGELKSPQDVEEALRAAALSIADWIAADWVRWDINHSLARPTGRIEVSDPLSSLRAYALRVTDTWGQVIPDGIEKAYAARQAQVAALMKSKLWIDRLPGKEILEKFLRAVAPGLARQAFLASAVSFMLKADQMHGELVRLREAIESKTKMSIAESG
ncbi:MAG: hypothetical protein ABI612_06360 [Betaproteobacteria bacterium]